MGMEVTDAGLLAVVGHHVLDDVGGDARLLVGEEDVRIGARGNSRHG
jgi:hypothetical protein